MRAIALAWALAPPSKDSPPLQLVLVGSPRLEDADGLLFVGDHVAMKGKATQMKKLQSWLLSRRESAEGTAHEDPLRHALDAKASVHPSPHHQHEERNASKVWALLQDRARSTHLVESELGDALQGKTKKECGGGTDCFKQKQKDLRANQQRQDNEHNEAASGVYSGDQGWEGAPVLYYEDGECVKAGTTGEEDPREVGPPCKTYEDVMTNRIYNLANWMSANEAVFKTLNNLLSDDVKQFFQMPDDDSRRVIGYQVDAANGVFGRPMLRSRKDLANGVLDAGSTVTTDRYPKGAFGDLAFENTAPRWKADEDTMNGFGTRLKNEYEAKVQEHDAADENMTAVFSTVDDTQQTWENMMSELNKNLTGEWEKIIPKEVVETWDAAKPPSRSFDFNRHLRQWGIHKKEALTEELHPIEDSLNVSELKLRDGMKDWKPKMDVGMADINEAFAQTVEDTDRQFYDWHEEEERNQDLLQKKDSFDARDFRDMAGQMNDLFRENKMALSKEFKQMAQEDRVFKKNTRVTMRNREKLEHAVMKDEERYVEEEATKDGEKAKDFARQGGRLIATREKAWAKLIKSIDKLRDRTIKEQENRLERQRSFAITLRDRANHARDYMQDIDFKQFSDLARLLGDLKLSLEEHKRAGDTLSALKGDNLIKEAQTEMEHFQHRVSGVLEDVSTEVSDMAKEQTTGAMEQMTLSRDAYDRKHAKFVKSLADVNDHLDYMKAMKQEQYRKLDAISTKLDEVVLALEKSLSLTDAKNGRKKIHASVTDELNTVRPFMRDLIADANKGRDELSFKGGRYGQGVQATLLQAADGVETLFTKFKNDLAKKQSDTTKDLNERLDALAEAYKTEDTPNGDIAKFEDDLKDVLKQIGWMVGIESEGRVGAFAALQADVKTQADSHYSDLTKDAAASDEQVKKLAKSLDSRLAMAKSKHENDLNTLLNEEAEASTARTNHFGDEVIPKRRQQIEHVYDTFASRLSDESARVNEAQRAAKNVGREKDALETDEGPKINALGLKAHRVEDGTKAAIQAIEQGADNAIGADLRKAEEVIPPLVDEIVKHGNEHTDKANAELAALQKKATGDIANSASWVSEATKNSENETRQLQEALTKIESEFSLDQLQQSSNAGTLSELVKGSLGRLSTIGLNSAKTQQQQAAALQAHAKALERQADKMFGKGEDGPLQQQFKGRMAKAQERMAAIMKDEAMSDEERKAKLDKVNDFLYDDMQRTKEALAKESGQAVKFAKEVEDTAQANAKSTTAADGEIRKDIATTGKESMAYEKEAADDLAGEIQPAEAILSTLNQVKTSLNKMKDADELRWKTQKPLYVEKAAEPMNAVMRDLQQSEQKSEAALHEANANARAASSNAIELEAQLKGSRRTLNNTMHRISNRLDSEVQALDGDLEEVQAHLNAGTGLVADLSANLSSAIKDIADNANTQIDQHRAESEDTEARLEKAEQLDVQVEQSSVAQLGTDARMAWASHSTLDQGFHVFAAKDQAFKDTVGAKLRELRGEAADVDAAALKAASSARLGLMDAKHDADRAIEGPVEDAKAEADARMVQIYADADKEIEKLLSNRDMSEAERKAAILKIKKDAQAKAQKLALEASKLRQQEIQLNAEMSRYDAAVKAKRAAIQSKIAAGHLSADAGEVQDHVNEADKVVHRQFRRAENAVGNLHSKLRSSFAEADEPKYSLAEAAAVFGVPGVKGLEAANDRLEAEDDALEQQVEALERHPQPAWAD